MRSPQLQQEKSSMSRTPVLAVLAAALTLVASGALAARAPLLPPAGTPMATSHLNPNTATAAQLRGNAAVGPALATAIVAGRPYARQADLMKVVAGKVTADKLPALYAAVFVPINLNTGTAEEFMTIPGMSARMVHEFEEYRPYTDMNQFNREIGKYAPPDEVARLASYVTLR